TELSGGQRQRVWVAMTLAQQTPTLLLDEPTTSLDIAYQYEMLELFAQLQRDGRTIVAVLHDLNQAARFADHPIVMRDGAIVSQGRPRDMLTEDLVEDVFALKSQIVPAPPSGSPMVIPLTRPTTPPHPYRPSVPGSRRSVAGLRRSVAWLRRSVSCNLTRPAHACRDGDRLARVGEGAFKRQKRSAWCGAYGLPAGDLARPVVTHASVTGRHDVSVQAAVVIAVAVLIGAALQRLSGMGLALVAAPVLAIVVGPVAGIFVMNVVGLVSSILVMLSVLADVEWRRFFFMLPGILVGAAMGALVVREVPASWLQILIGAVVLIGLATTFGVPGLPLLTSRFLTPAAGAASGFVSATAGVSSPPMVIYAKLAGWDQRPFAGTMQPIFITTALSAVVTKIVL